MTAMATVTVQPGSADRWWEYRDLRLAALASDPDAFTSAYDTEADLADDQWRARSAMPGTFIGYLDGQPAGTAGLVPGTGPRRDLVGVWTTPAARGHGVAEALCGAVIEMAQQSGAVTVALQVAEHAHAARRLYQRLGFTDTGRREPMPKKPTHTLIEMTLSLGHCG